MCILAVVNDVTFDSTLLALKFVMYVMQAKLFSALLFVKSRMWGRLPMLLLGSFLLLVSQLNPLLVEAPGKLLLILLLLLFLLL